jgi:hypothetical protein
VLGLVGRSLTAVKDGHIRIGDENDVLAIADTEVILMDSAFLAALGAQYQWQATLLTGVLIIAITLIAKRAMMLVPTFRDAARLNSDTYDRKMERPNYAANQAWNRKWAALYLPVIFAGILPFCVTADAQPWWQIPRDVAIILMFYDFFYYLVHRFLFHDGGFLGGPLMWVHAVHHRQHVPCRGDLRGRRVVIRRAPFHVERSPFQHGTFRPGPGRISV